MKLLYATAVVCLSIVTTPNYATEGSVAFSCKDAKKFGKATASPSEKQVTKFLSISYSALVKENMLDANAAIESCIEKRREKLKKGKFGLALAGMAAGILSKKPAEGAVVAQAAQELTPKEAKDKTIKRYKNAIARLDFVSIRKGFKEKVLTEAEKRAAIEKSNIELVTWMRKKVATPNGDYSMVKMACDSKKENPERHSDGTKVEMPDEFHQICRSISVKTKAETEQQLEAKLQKMIAGIVKNKAPYVNSLSINKKYLALDLPRGISLREYISIVANNPENRVVIDEHIMGDFVIVIKNKGLPASKFIMKDDYGDLQIVRAEYLGQRINRKSVRKILFNFYIFYNDEIMRSAISMGLIEKK